jgi:Tfp pilus assembly protein PilF
VWLASSFARVGEDSQCHEQLMKALTLDPNSSIVHRHLSEYHDNVVENDWKRQKHLEAMGWKVLRFGDKDVETVSGLTGNPSASAK